MNTTTFTIESVHGVKQTFVLGSLDRSVSGQVPKEKPGQMQSKPDGATLQGTASSTR